MANFLRCFPRTDEIMGNCTVIVLPPGQASGDLRACVRAGYRRPVMAAGSTAHSNFAGDANGLVASTTNMTSWSRSVVPALKTSIGMSPPWPFIDSPASA
jgi:hypothetical protein